MIGGGARRAGLFFGVTALLAGCGHRDTGADLVGNAEVNAYPTNYKGDIIAAMHSYLNDPTGIRSAVIAPPALKETGNVTRYVACLQFNPKKNAKDYAGLKTVAVVFLAGRLDHFVETTKDECAGVTYAPFPELQKLPP